ncbi:MAG: DUF4058 family protein [Elainellaceae cyanobacterium]
MSRSFERPEAALYEWLQEAIPSFPVPLREGEAEPVVAMQRMLDEVYRRARFDLAIDYGQRVVPGLAEGDGSGLSAFWRRLQSDGDRRLGTLGLD